MPPKKKLVEEETSPLYLGRFGTSLKIGIVGVPNVGKSTFFNVLTKQSIPAENFPFCTIDPNEARVAVPDERFNYLCDKFGPPSKIPAYLNVVDIAGLVKGASEGAGLGNAFLSHIAGCDAIFSMMRVFDDADVIHVDGEVDPLRDTETIFSELRLKDLEYVNKQIEKTGKVVARLGDKDKVAKCEHETLLKVKEHLENGKDVRKCAWNNKEIEALNNHLLLTSKPVIYLINMSEKDYIKKKNKWLAKIKAYIDAEDPGATMIPFSGTMEMRLLDEPEEAKTFLEERKTTSALDKIIVTGFKSLGLQYFFTVGEDEVRAWTIQRHTKAPQAAGKIHGDMERGFIKAEVMKYDDFKEHGTEALVKAAGKYRLEGKNYEFCDGDIINIKFNVTDVKKDKK